VAEAGDNLFVQSCSRRVAVFNRMATMPTDGANSCGWSALAVLCRAPWKFFTC